ncbi:MAG TPA: ABC transporter permease [Pseudonocardiaceae bacterium]
MTATASSASGTAGHAGSSGRHERTRWTGSSVPTQIMVLTGRSLRALRDPHIIVMSLLQPMVMVTLFSQVFRSIAQTPGFPAGVEYIDYLMPAILVTTATQTSLWSGVGLANDLRNGALARFRAMPIRMGSLLTGRSLSDLVRNTVQLVILTVTATLLYGYGPAGGVTGTLGALLLAMVLGWGLSWVFIAVACWVRNVEAMQMVGFIAIFPLMFASSAYVPVENLPGWLQAIADVNPLTYAIDAARGLALGNATPSPVIAALVTCAVLVVVAGPLAARGIRRS